MSLLEKTLVVSKQQQMQHLAQEVSRQIFMADDLGEALDMVATINPDLVVFDDFSTPDHVQHFVTRTDNTQADIPVVVVAGEGGQLSDEFRRAGAHDYLEDTNSQQLREIALALKSRPAQAAPGEPCGRFFVDRFAASVPIVGTSAATRDELNMIKLVASSQCNPVLITGPTGTGKEMAAQAVHALRHPQERFVALNCAALTANLLESELFGHVKGSFTGADREKTGLFELAGAGTIFLDEISEMPQDLQAKLLRVLQEKTFRKVGGTKDIVCGATIVASSNRKLKEEVAADRFRRDLYYRLSVCPIVIAPLQSSRRCDDIPLLAEYFLQHSSICPTKQGKIRSFTKLALEALKKHDWPGNVRELRNVIDRAIMLETTDKIGMSSIVIDPEACKVPGESGVLAGITEFSLARAERELIARALKETGWQKTQAASLLGITRATLYAKVKQYNIEKEDGPAIRHRQTKAFEPESVPV